MRYNVIVLALLFFFGTFLVGTLVVNSTSVAEGNIPNSSNGFSYDDIVGKKFYIIESEYSCRITMEFINHDQLIINYGSEDEFYSYYISPDEIIHVSEESWPWMVLTLQSKHNDHYVVIMDRAGGPFVEKTSVSGTNSRISDFSTFNNSATLLKDWFLENGLWESTITEDGQIFHPTVSTVGRWWVKDNIFYYDYPDEDTGCIDRKALKIENNKLYRQTDAPYTDELIWYFEESVDNKPPAAPKLTVTTHGTTVTISWTSVENADGYTLFYAPYPEANYIGDIDMGNQTSLPSFDGKGYAFYVAVQAHNSAGSSGYSNIEYFSIAAPDNIILSSIDDTTSFTRVTIKGPSAVSPNRPTELVVNLEALLDNPIGSDFNWHSLGKGTVVLVIPNYCTGNQISIKVKDPATGLFVDPIAPGILDNIACSLFVQCLGQVPYLGWSFTYASDIRDFIQAVSDQANPPSSWIQSDIYKPIAVSWEANEIRTSCLIDPAELEVKFKVSGLTDISSVKIYVYFQSWPEAGDSVADLSLNITEHSIYCALDGNVEGIHPSDGSTFDAGETISFDGSGSDSDGSIVSYQWDFGDSSTSTEQNPSHAYSSAGTYTVTLTVTDDDGATGTDSVQIIINSSSVGGSIVGSWGKGHYTDSNGAEYLSLTFYPNGYYIHYESDDPSSEDDNGGGVEYGKYDYNSQTGKLVVTSLIVNENGDHGLSDYVPGGECETTATINGDTITFSSICEDGWTATDTFERVKSDSLPIVGSWGKGHYTDSNGAEYLSLTFYLNGYYIHYESDDPSSEDDNGGGVEYGKYDYNSQTGKLVVTSLIVNENGDHGLSDFVPGGDCESTVTIDANTITFSETCEDGWTETNTFERVKR